MNSSLEALEGNTVKLSVNIDEAEFDREIDRAFRKIATEIRLPGFRNGKAPRRVLEARIGVAPAREQALRDAIPQFLAKAVREHDVDLIASPDVEITGGTDDGPVAFDATCQVRPEITVPGYGGLRVELPSPDASDDEIDEIVQGELRRHASLSPVDRPGAIGDVVTLDVEGSREDEPVAGLNTEDWAYEIGQGWVADDFDEQLVGAEDGDELEFTTTPRGTDEPVDFHVRVGAVQELVLPEPTDEWVQDTFGEVDTVQAWRASIRERLEEIKLDQARQQLVGRVTDALAQLTDIEAPAPLVHSEMQRRLEGTVRQLQAQGVDVNEFLSATGQDGPAFVESMRGPAEQAVKVDLALRAVAAAEALEADDGDLATQYERMAVQAGQKANQVRKAYEKADFVPELVAQIRRAKALDWLLHHVELVDPDGHPLDRDRVLGHTDDDHTDDDHTDDHDNDDSTPANEPEEATR
ncbi:MAG: trigger factor [Acidimicrobiia bacterium]|nr:trigger factor [Acidimicrobiia bacterium]